MKKYMKLLEHGNKAQLEQMNANNHKTGWDNFPIELSTAYIKINLDNLLDAVYGERGKLMTSRSTKDIRRIAANIANYAHMIVLKCDNDVSHTEK